MPAIGTVWKTGTWDVDAWKADTWENATAPVVANYPASPTQLIASFVNTELEVLNFGPTLLLVAAPINTALELFDPDGFIMPTPITFSQGETGGILFRLIGADGTAENLATASLVQLRVVGDSGTPLTTVNLTGGNDQGEVTWTRQPSDTGTPGDYRMQITVLRGDGTVGLYPDAQRGLPLTILSAV